MSYTILGKKILNEHIAIGVYTAVGLGVYAAMRGGSDAKAAAPVALPATSSDDEATFIRDFIAKLEKEDATAKH